MRARAALTSTWLDSSFASPRRTAPAAASLARARAADVPAVRRMRAQLPLTPEDLHAAPPGDAALSSMIAVKTPELFTLIADGESRPRTCRSGRGAAP